MPSLDPEKHYPLKTSFPISNREGAGCKNEWVKPRGVDEGDEEKFSRNGIK